MTVPIFGVDKDPEAVIRMSKICEGVAVGYTVKNIMDVDDFMYDTVLLLSVWPYIFSRFGASDR